MEVRGTDLPVTLRNALSRKFPSAADIEGPTCLEHPPAPIAQDAERIYLVRKSKVTSVNRETTDDT